MQHVLRLASLLSWQATYKIIKCVSYANVLIIFEVLKPQSATLLVALLAALYREISQRSASPRWTNRKCQVLYVHLVSCQEVLGETHQLCPTHRNRSEHWSLIIRDHFRFRRSNRERLFHTKQPSVNDLTNYLLR